MVDQLPADLEAAAALLYEQPPADFVTVRGNLANSAAERGDRQLADLIKKLRKPTVSAWTLNLLSRYATKEMDELLELGPKLATATRRGQASELRTLSARRQQLQGVLMQRAKRLLSMHRLKMSASVAYEVESTLTAAVADPDVATAVRSGRLERPAQYAGLGPGPPLRLVPGTGPDDDEDEDAGADAAVFAAETAEDAKARYARELAAAQRRREKAAAELERRQVERDRLTASQAELTQRLEALKHDLSELKRRLVKAEDEVAAAEVRLGDASEALATAERALAKADPAGARTRGNT
ncbi:MAG: hypothetical protein L0Y54_15845 [Sporichthyaceae bacterium]|nr:hypothetical protein [Sporichthyaceae bacterium]